MSAQVQTQQAVGAFTGRIVVGLLAFVIAVAAVVAIGSTIGSDTRTDGTAVSEWDAGKLEAMEGRQIAATVGTGTVVWDSFMSEAMVGRQLAESFRTTAPAIAWDAAKLEAFEGRQLAEAFRPPEIVVWDSWMSQREGLIRGQR